MLFDYINDFRVLSYSESTQRIFFRVGSIDDIAFHSVGNTKESRTVGGVVSQYSNEIHIGFTHTEEGNFNSITWLEFLLFLVTTAKDFAREMTVRKIAIIKPIDASYAIGRGLDA